jgi:hypothetical protein
MQLSMMLWVRETLAPEAPCLRAESMQNFAIDISLLSIISNYKDMFRLFAPNGQAADKDGRHAA